MHDILEGVCKYDFILILNYYIYDANLFSLNTLIFIIKSFDYGDGFVSNRPPQISEDHLKKGNLKMSASEMYIFFTLFGVMVGHLIPENDLHWSLYISLRKICDIVFCKCIFSGDIDVLRDLISEHYYIYSCTLGQALKPKHHHMIHYSNMIKMSGPLINFWCMRFEAKHKPLKTSSVISCSKKNICLTIALKHQLKMCHKFISWTAGSQNFKHGTITFIQDHFLLRRNNSFTDTVSSVKWVELNGISYKLDNIIQVGADEMPYFGKISSIYILDNNEICFEYTEFDTVAFDNHFHAYEVNLTSSVKLFTIKSFENNDVGGFLLTSNLESKNFITSKCMI